MSNLPLSLLEEVRKKNPVVLTIANMVTPDKVADALSAIGASPIMSVAPEEAPAMVELADAITINLGTLNHEQAQEISTILDANPKHKPLVLDPVAIGASKYRLNFAQRLLSKYQFTVIRANAGEIATLANSAWTSHGIDSGNGTGDIEEIAQKVAQQYKCTVVLTGKEDVITDGNRTFTNSLSTKYFATNVGSGDMLSSIIAAFLAVNNDPYLAASSATKIFTAAGVKAARETSGFGHWQIKLMDELAQINSSEILSIL